jgi:hypothetical protein
VAENNPPECWARRLLQTSFGRRVRQPFLLSSTNAPRRARSVAGGLPARKTPSTAWTSRPFASPAAAATGRHATPAIRINGPSRLVYDPAKRILSCGARLVIEVESGSVEIVSANMNVPLWVRP